MELLDKMNEGQKQSVMTTEGALLVVAGAGTGKTRVLTHRISYLVTEKRVAPQNILAITFTNKAGFEMKKRIEKLIGERAKKVWISTFHSLCRRILKQHIHLLGYDSDFKMIDGVQQRILIKRVIENMDIKDWSLSEIITEINQMKESVTVNIKETDKDKSLLLEIYKRYQEALFQSNSVDFGDLIRLTLHLFYQYPDVLVYYQNQFRYIHIDEYQDTNQVQHRLIKWLVGKLNNVCAVGDTDQCIYDWRGADIQNILSFKSDYPNATVILLEQNYRSKQMILNVANDIIQQNKKRWEKKLWSSCGEGDKAEYYRAIDDEGEAFFISQKILSLCPATYNYEDVAILCRTTSQFKMIEKVLIKQGIPYQKNGEFDFFKRKEIKDVMAYLRLICFGEDNLSFERILNTPKRGVGIATFNKLAQLAILSDVSLIEVIEKSNLIFSKNTQQKLILFKQLIHELREENENYSMSDFIQLVLKKTGYLDMLETEGKKEKQMRLRHLESFGKMAKQFEEEGLMNLLIMEQKEGMINELTKLDKLKLFMNELILHTENKQEVEKSKVALLTIHASKGLEFPVVFLTGMEEGTFPLYSTIKKTEEIEEERRLAYVGVTRAEEQLYFTGAKQRMWKNRTITTVESRFIKEINLNHVIYSN